MIYDIAIIGLGASGSHLLLHFLEDPFFQEKKFLIIEKQRKKNNEKTWSFWEKDTGKWNDIIYKKWNKSKFYSSDHDISLNFNPYVYKTIRSNDLFDYMHKKIQDFENVTIIYDEIKDIKDTQIQGGQDTYQAQLIFDSRVPKFLPNKEKYIWLMQHFKGWFIETLEDSFDDEYFIMMDYRLKWDDSTSFIYVLPFSKRSALIEFTFFNQFLIKDHMYDAYLKNYIKNYLNISSYTIKEIEKGNIPMTTYPYHKFHKKNIVRIGEGGGWIRPSSGYSFKNGDRYSKKMLDNLKKGYPPHRGIGIGRYRLYDNLFLHVLESRNDLGETIFGQFYSKNTVQEMFSFLDEEGSLSKDIRLMLSLNTGLFRKTLWNSYIKK